MILLLGASGYLGQALVHEMRNRGMEFVALRRRDVDYTQLHILFDFVRRTRPSFLINAAGVTGRPSLDACELARAQTLHGNTIMPQTIARVCLMRNIPWGHISSGSIYQGVKTLEGGKWVVERNLNQPDVRQGLQAEPENWKGFEEADEPNFSFLCPPCNFYCGTKALAEEAIKVVGECYIWRPALPFANVSHPRNWLSRLQTYPRILDCLTSATHIGDFARVCLDLWEKRAPFGIYNVVNPGAVSTREIAEQIQSRLHRTSPFQFWRDEEEFGRFAVKAPRSHAILSASKLLATGVRMRSVSEAIEEAMDNWQGAVHEGQDWAHDPPAQLQPGNRN
jgi:dTDP-4-dehydrorhamnose reductase